MTGSRRRRWIVLAWCGFAAAVLGSTAWLLATGTRGAEIANVLALPVACAGLALAVIAGTRASGPPAPDDGDGDGGDDTAPADESWVTGLLRRLNRRRAVVVTVALPLIAVAGVLVAVLADSGVVGRIEGRPIAVGTAPADIQAGGGAIWTANSGDASLSRVDAVTGRSERIAVGGSPWRIVATNTTVWTLDLDGRVGRYDMASARFVPVANGSSPASGITVAGGFLWIARADSGTVDRFDPRTSTIDRESIPAGDSPSFMTSDGRQLYVGGRGSTVVTIIDEASGRVADTVPVPKLSQGLGYDNGALYVVDTELHPGGGTTAVLTPVDTASFIVGVPLRIDNVSAVTDDADPTFLWAAYPLENVLRKIDLRTLAPAGPPVEGVGRNASGIVTYEGYVWIADKQDATVSRVRIS